MTARAATTATVIASMTLGDLRDRLRALGPLAELLIGVEHGLARVEVRLGRHYYGAAGPVDDLESVVATALDRASTMASS